MALKRRATGSAASERAAAVARLDGSPRTQRLLDVLRRPRVRPFDRNATSPEIGAALLASQSGVFALPPLDRAAGGPRAGRGRARCSPRRAPSTVASTSRRDRTLTAPPTPSAAEREMTAEWRKCPSLRRLRLPQAAEAPARRLPGVQPPLPARACASGSTSCSTRARSTELGGRARAARRARASSTPSPTRSGSRAPSAPRRPSGARLRARATIDDLPLVARRDRLRLHRRQHRLGSRARRSRSPRSSRSTSGTPLLVISASGGARMQEGAVSLMQMVKTSAGDRAARARRASPTSRCSPTRPTAASARRSRRSATC